MPVTPHDWSIIVVGHWNQAILTPTGVAQRLLGLAADTPVQVEVALDAFLPYRIRHENVIVTPYSEKLQVQPTSFNYRAFEAAKTVARAGLEGLPLTPVFAAGLNLNFKTNNYVDELSAVTGHAWDDRILDEHLEISTRTTARSLAWRGGRINVAVSQEADMTFSVLLNYDRRSNVIGDLIEWLSVPIQDVQRTTEQILFRCLGLTPGDIQYVNQT